MKADSVTGHHSMLSKWGQASSGWEWDFYIQDGKLSLMLNAEDSDCGGTETFAYVESKLITANKWTHVTATYDGSKIRFYINGTVYPASSYSNMPVAELCDTSEKMRLGVSGYYDNDYIGYLDEAKISNYAKSNKEVCEQDMGYKWQTATGKCKPVDFDKDGFTIVQGDCDDTNPQKYPGNGCSGVTGQSLDGLQNTLSTANAGGDGRMSTSTFTKQLAFAGTIENLKPVNKKNPKVLESVGNWRYRDIGGYADSAAKSSQKSVVVSESSMKPPLLKAERLNSEPSKPQSSIQPSSQSSLQSSMAAQTTYRLYYYFQDHLGNTAVVTDERGNIVEAMDYLPFGAVNIDQKYSSEYSPNYTFTGKEKDQEEGLFYFGARYYNDATGKFTSIDPALFDPEHLLKILISPQLLNSYSYVGNNPVKFIDPNGEDRIDIALGYAAGLFKGSWDIIKGSWNILRHPIDTANNLGSILAHPKLAYAAFEEYLGDKYDEFINADDYRAGEMIGEVVGGLATAAAAAKFAATIVKFAKIAKIMDRVISLLKPGGKLIGKAGGVAENIERIRIINGTMEDAEKFFNELTKDGKIVENSRYPGKFVEMPDGSNLGLRPSSKSGPPTIDTYGLEGVKEIKFVQSD